MNAFRIRLTPDELNAILRALGRQPYEDVFQTVQSLHAQAQAQVEASQATAAKAAAARAARAEARAAKVGKTAKRTS